LQNIYAVLGTQSPIFSSQKKLVSTEETTWWGY